MAERKYTLTGPVDIDALGLILPHEHLFTDLRGPLVAGYAQTETNLTVLAEAARRGAYLEFDSVAAPHQSQAELVETSVALIEAGFADPLLLSHDAGWYTPARPDGLPEQGFRGYTALTKEFLPALLERGVTEEQVRVITVDNPVRAFAF